MDQIIMIGRFMIGRLFPAKTGKKYNDITRYRTKILYFLYIIGLSEIGKRKLIK